MTFTARVAAYFTAYPDQWLDGRALAQIGGAYAWRTRVSECRQLGMAIDNRLRVLPSGVRVSEYRYRPPVAGQLSLVQDEAHL